MTFNLRTDFDLQNCIPMAREEEARCANEYLKTKAPLLAEQMTRANMRLVVKIARDYRRGNHDMRDLIQEGNLGLMQAVARFDPDRGVKLCSYAAWWIRAYILKFVIDNWRLVKTGTTQAQRKLFFSLHKQQHRLQQSGIEADAKQLAEAMDVKEKDVISMIERFSAGEVAGLVQSLPGIRCPVAGGLAGSFAGVAAGRSCRDVRIHSEGAHQVGYVRRNVTR
jgi:RNA polymerase sigma-32 factor